MTAKKIEVTLLKPHTHGSKQYCKGDKINVAERQIKWLAERGIIQAR